MEDSKCPCYNGHGHGKCCHCCCHDGECDGEKLPRLSSRVFHPDSLNMVDKYKQEQFLRLHPVKHCCPHIVEFSPWSAVPGSLMVIIGHGFEPQCELNTVTVGGSKALVVTAECHHLVVICSWQVKAGLKTKHGVASGPRDFIVLSWPPPTPEADGPPFSFEGLGDGSALDLRTKFNNLQAAHLLTGVEALC